MKTYELSYIISPEIASDGALAKAQEIESAIQSREGVILKQLNPTAKTLAYPIEKKASGFFGVLEFQIEPEKLLELKEIISKDGKIVRHLIIIKEPAKIKKERRSKRIIVETPVVEQKIEKEKVELKDIEQQLDEILG